MGIRHDDTLLNGTMSQKGRTIYNVPPAPSIDNPVSRPSMERSTTAGQRLSLTSVASSGKRSSSSFEGAARTSQHRPSGIPRATSATSQARLHALATSRAGSVASKSRSSPITTQPVKSKLDQGLLARTMSSSQGHRPPRRREDDPLQRRNPPSTLDTDPDSILGVALPHMKTTSVKTTLPPRLIPELQALAATHRRPILTPSSISTRSSPSTQFTGSPGPWSASTTTTTSTSWSSASPCILQSSRSPGNSKRSLTVPMPAIPRSRMPSLPVLQETSASHSSLKTSPGKEAVTPPRKLKKTPINSPAPTPPPRMSSVKRTRSRSSSKSEHHSAEPTDDEPPPLPERAIDRPVIVHGLDEMQFTALPQPPEMTDYHNNLQTAINSMSSPHLGSPYESISSFPSDKSPSKRSTKLLAAAHITTDRIVNSDTANAQTARSRLAKFSKLALFNRAVKASVAEPELKPQPRKLQRKGPTAGTGHEGYGKYGRKSRKTQKDGTGTDSEASVTSTGSRSGRPAAGKENNNANVANVTTTTGATATNTNSDLRRRRESQAKLDDFASTRMKPVTIRGGTQQFRARSRTVDDDLRSEDQVPVPTAHEIITGGLNSSRERSNTENSNVTTSQRTTSPGSSQHKQSIDHERPTRPDMLETYRLPDPSRIHEDESSVRPFVEGWNTSQSSFAPSFVTSTDGGSDMYRVDTSMLEQGRRKTRRSKWNIFRKRDASIESSVGNHDPDTHQISQRGLAVSINDNALPRTVPYYAMLESESEANTTEAIGDYLQEAAQFADADDEEGFGTPLIGIEHEIRERVESVLLPSAPQFRRDIVRSRTVSRRENENRATTQERGGLLYPNREPRQPRLAQVGRIPKVIPTETVKQNNRKSFSRPFTKLDSDDFELHTRHLGHNSSELVPDLPGLLPMGSNAQLLPSTTYIDPRQLPAKLVTPQAPPIHQDSEQQLGVDYRRFYDRQSSTSSSSEGRLSIMGPPLLPTQDIHQSLHQAYCAEEDVWNEYDDLIDRVATNPRLRRSVARIDTSSRFDQEHVETSQSYGNSDAPSLTALARNLAIDTTFGQVPIIFSSPEILQEAEMDQEVRLRRSRIISALHSSMDPASPFSIGDYLREHMDQHRSSGILSGHASHSTLGRPVSPPLTGPTAALPAVPEDYRYENSLHMAETQRAKNPVKHSELSYASLMISRWLSFGQVLFSPAHAELERQPEKQVLVIDGLGNEDWSMYCAVTYQAERAYVYDLKEMASMRHTESQRLQDNVPPNYRRRQIASFENVFNFPDSFFSVIVLRFPPAMAESKLKNIVSECHRVLAPGGYIELMILDLDITNMGVVTRRALRDLKTKMSISNPAVSLRPVIDNVQGVLGEKGFTKLNRFIVGVPVIGKPPSSADSPVSSRSSDGSEQVKLGPATPVPAFQGASSGSGQALSLHDLVADHSDGADIKISKMVSRTARNWWQHCFEAAVISDGNLTRSILANKQVLSECKGRASAFKLLIAHAQKPATTTFQSKRRTMSESYISKIAYV